MNKNILINFLPVKQDFHIFYYFTNTSLEILHRSFMKYTKIIKEYLIVVKLNEEFYVNLEKYIISILSKAGYLNSVILYFNNGAVISVMTLYLTIIELIKIYESNRINNDNNTNEDEKLHEINEKFANLFARTADVCNDKKNETTKIKTIRKIFGGGKKYSKSVRLLELELLKIE